MQSGSAFSTRAINSRRNGRLFTTTFATITACYRRKVKNMLTCLQELTVQELLNAEMRMMAWNMGREPLFKPMVEGEDTFLASLPRAPHELTYEVNEIPWILGITSAEALSKVNNLFKQDKGKWAKEINERYSRYLPIMAHLTYISDPEKLDEIAERIKVYYFGSEDISSQTEDRLVKMLSDITFVHPLIQTVRSHRGKSFVYLYDHKNQEKKYKNASGNYEKDLGVNHGEELFELYGSRDGNLTLSSSDYRISKQLIDYWTNFAIYGNPNGKVEADSKELWVPSESNEIDYLWIRTEESTMKKGLFQKRINFLNSLPLNLHWLKDTRAKDTKTHQEKILDEE